jgi:RNA polymerase sigma factor (sigma-70 family)
MDLLKAESPDFRLAGAVKPRSLIGLTNRELADAFRNNRREVLEQLYWEHRGDIERLVGSALRRARQFSHADVSDVVQDVFTKAFSLRVRAAYDGERAYGPFLRRIAHNTVVDWLRRNRCEAVRHVELLLAFETLTPISSWEEDVFSPALLAAAERYVIGLEPMLKAVHERRFLAADSQTAAARKLGISRQNLRTLERQLLAGLRREISVLTRS